MQPIATFVAAIALLFLPSAGTASHRQSLRVAYPSLGLPQAPLWIASDSSQRPCATRALSAGVPTPAGQVFTHLARTSGRHWPATQSLSSGILSATSPSVWIAKSWARCRGTPR